MATPLKNIFDQQFIADLSKNIKKHYPNWKEKLFVKKIFDLSWDKLELKGRTTHITDILKEMLPENYPSAIKILTKVAKGRTGYQHSFFPSFVERYGLDDFQTSIKALEYFTQFSSSEFAVRPFIIKDTIKMMEQMQKWSKSPNHHVRRLASEGCRPRLPWATRLTQFIDNPSPIWIIIETLKQDKSLYVRKSVANNLNDIAKDHPSEVLDFAKKNYGENIHTDWIIKHGLRTLLKASNDQALNIIGYQSSNNLAIKDFTWSKKTTLGNNILFSFTLTSNEPLGHLRLEYEIEFVRLHRKTSKKIFKIGEGKISADAKSYQKQHSFKPISTRKYYSGQHRLSILVNGKKIATGAFELVV